MVQKSYRLEHGSMGGRFNVTNHSRRTFTWREAGTHYLPSSIWEIDNYGSGGLMVWAMLISYGHALIHTFKIHIVSGMRYRNAQLEQCVNLLIDIAGADFILMEYNARPQGVHFGWRFSESENIHWVDWPVL